MLASVLHTASYDLRTSRMIIGNYTADVSVGETAPSPISSEPSCRKDTIRGGRVLEGGDACHVSAGDSPAGVGVGSIELSRDEAVTVDRLRSSLGGDHRRRRASASRERWRRASPGRTCRRGRRASSSAPPPPPPRAVRLGSLTSFRCGLPVNHVAVASRPRQFPGGSPPRIFKQARVLCEREGELTDQAALGPVTGSMPESFGTVAF